MIIGESFLQNLSIPTVCMLQGRIQAQGSYDDLLERGVDFVHLLAKETDQEEEKKKKEASEAEETEESDKPKKETKKFEETKDCDKPDAKKENMAEGRVTAKTYWSYFKAGDSVFGISFLITGFLLTQILVCCNDYWLSLWYVVIFLMIYDAENSI